ncbi:phospholipase D family protein [Shewanella sp. 10N.286.51.B2]|uniref:phospholipase D family protein n=1 Tax=unclassified Shewanella TaxID=196818 RepID=UPI0026E3E2E4|nr:phospholipase D family protein [Shewanella sp. 3_MG-2023]MDO6774054.1 phospholipase D family protein [Shewanella sp. 3_MG-2023]
MNMHSISKCLTVLSFIIVTIVVTGCATSYPEVEDGFQADWDSKKYHADLYLIPTAPEALARRIELVRQAKSFIDMTYFSWNKDTSGLMLFAEIKQAADRGVKVRVTLDDLLVFNEKWLAELAHHQNIDIRIFNPFDSRKMGWIGRAMDFQIHQQQLDNRLHEKYFNVDGHNMILGGRNIGDDYFGYSTEANFFDLDVIFKGDVIKAFEANFDGLWGTDYLIPIEMLVEVKQVGVFTEFEKTYRQQTENRQQVVNAINQQVQSLTEVGYTAAVVKPVFDSLEKMKDSKPYFRSRVENLMTDPVNDAKKAVISTPYLIPTDNKFTIIEKLSANNAQITLITNSSASNDSGFVPAYFEKHRPLLLDMGADLYEYKDHAKNSDHFYHSDTYYHNKTFIFDDLYSYIGSSNFDPRSDFLNIEFGVLIKSPEFALTLEHYLLANKELLYWHVTQQEDGSINWQSGDESYDASPHYGGWHALPDWLIRKMNGESEL